MILKYLILKRLNILKVLKLFGLSVQIVLNIINYGEQHGFDSKINFNVFKDDKICFYTETLFYEYQKKIIIFFNLIINNFNC